MDIIKNGCCQSGQENLKLTVSQEVTNRMNWFFAYWCKFRKATSYFNDFQVCMVKNGHVHLVHKILKSPAS